MTDLDQWSRASQRAKRYGKPVLAKIGDNWLLVPETLNGGAQARAMFKAYIDRRNGIDTEPQLVDCWNCIVNVVNTLDARKQMPDAVKVLARYRVKKVDELPREWRPALLYDLKQLLKETRP